MKKIYKCKNCKARTDKQSMLLSEEGSLHCPNCKSLLVKTKNVIAKELLNLKTDKRRTIIDNTDSCGRRKQ